MSSWREMREWGTGYAGGFTVWISETGPGRRPSTSSV